MTLHTRLNIERLDERCQPSFSPAASYAAGDYPQEVVTADFNSDSILDVAVANLSGGTVGVLLGNANGTFQAAVHSPAGNQPYSLTVGDFNEDGKPDLATAQGYGGSSNNTVTVLLGNGNGMFDPPTGYAVGFGYGVDTVAVGDFNADKNLDLAITSLFFDGGGSDGSYVGVLLGTGAGTFTNPPEWPWQGWSALGGFEFLPDTVVADFNADGILDIAAPSFYGYLPVGRGNGDGTFSGPTTFSGVAEGSSIVAADFNADGKVDLAVTGDSSVGVLLGNGNGYFDTTQYFSAGSGSHSDLAVADFNGDGKLDLIVPNNSSGTVGVLLGTGAGAVSLAVNAVVGTGPAGVAVGDFNGDGRPDAAVANADSNTVSVLLNDGAWPDVSSPRLRIADATIREGNTGTTNAVFTVTLSAASAQPVTVQFTTANGSAISGSDYLATAGTLLIPAGQTTGTIIVPIIGDRLGEPNEAFSLNLGNTTNAIIDDGQAVGAITDDEPRINISDVTKREGRRNKTTLFTFTVTLTVPGSSLAYDQPVTMSFRTADGTATTSDNDYVAKSGTLTFAPGETTKTITIEVKGDNKREADEYFYMDLFGNSSNSLFTKSRGIGTILNDD